MAVAVLFTASCAKEDISSSIGGGEVEVTFTANLPELGTRAEYGDGTQVNKLRYYVYDNKGTLLSDLSKQKGYGVGIKVGTPTTVNLVLLKGMTYNIVFWADYNELYDYDPETKKINVENFASVTANDETRDAFYAYVTIDPAEEKAEEKANVTLRRPFAQLNAISTDDMTAHTNAGIELDKSTVTLDVYSTFNVATGKAEDLVKNKTLQYGDVLEDGLISMNYFFASKDESYTTNVTLAVKYSNTASYSREFTYVPLKQNYRTNIIGELLSKSTEFTVTIEEEFGKDEPESTYVATIEDLQAAINAAGVGETKIVLGANMNGNVTVIQKEGVKIIIDGNDRKFDGTIKVHSNSNHYPNAALTIQNVKFETATESLNFIEALENGAARYSTNITVQDCTFTAVDTRSAISTAVGVQIKASKNAKVLNCTATGLHSLVQAQSCDETVVVKGCTINGKNGVAFKQVKNAVVEGTTITATGYGIRFDGNTDNYGIVVKDNNVTAVQPLIIRKMTGANNSIALEGTNTLNTEADYQIVITKDSDDAAYVKPTGTYTLTGAEDYVVYPRDYQCPVATWDEFTAALAAGEPKVMLTENITVDDSKTITNSVVINLNKKAFEISNATKMLNIGDSGNSSKPNVTIQNGNLNCMIYALSGEVVIKDVVFGGTIAYVSNSQGVISTKHANLLMENCKMTNVKKSGATKPRSLLTEGRSSGYLILRNCDFKNTNLDRPYINPLNNNAVLELTNCKLYSLASNIDIGASYIWNNMNLTGCSGGFTFTISRASTTLTDEEIAIYKAIKKNNSGSMRFIFTDGEKNNL